MTDILQSNLFERDLVLDISANVQAIALAVVQSLDVNRTEHVPEFVSEHVRMVIEYAFSLRYDARISCAVCRATASCHEMLSRLTTYTPGPSSRRVKILSWLTVETDVDLTAGLHVYRQVFYTLRSMLMVGPLTSVGAQDQISRTFTQHEGDVSRLVQVATAHETLLSGDVESVRLFVSCRRILND